MTYMCTPTHMNESRDTYERVMAYMWMGDVTCTNELFYIWTRHDIHVNTYTYKWFTQHVWTSHSIHVNGWCHVYEWIMLHMNESWNLLTYMNESCHTYEWVMSMSWVISRRKKICFKMHWYSWIDSSTSICIYVYIHVYTYTYIHMYTMYMYTYIHEYTAYIHT